MTSTTHVTSVTIDCSLSRGEDLDTFLAGVESTYGLKANVLRRQGPAGGNPEVKLEGAVTSLALALREQWDFSPDEVADFVGRSNQARPVHGVPEPAASDAWIDRFKPSANVWNHYTEFKTENLTTAKLADFLNDLNQGHQYLLGGEPADVVTPAEDGWEVLSVHHTGGRDWVVILGNVGP